MKIMFNCLTLEKGGAERVISVLANKLVNKNDVAICSLKNTEIMYEIDNRIQVFKVDKRKETKKSKILKIFSKLSLNRIYGLKKIITSYKPDIIISFLPEPSFRLMLVKKIWSNDITVPVIVSVRNDPKREYKNKIIKNVMRYLYKNLDGLVLQTNEAKKYFDECLPMIKNSTVIVNPIDDKFLVNAPCRKTRLKEIVTVGRLEPQKNQILLIDGFIDFYRKHLDYKLKIYGEGSLRKKLYQYIKDKQMEKTILLMGNTNNVKENIYNASCFVLSSDYEGMPNSLMEAMALGIPCISTDCPCGGPRDLISDKEDGFLYEVNNKEKLTELLCSVADNEEVINIISNNAAKKMKRFNSNNIARQWYAYIKEVLGDV